VDRYCHYGEPGARLEFKRRHLPTPQFPVSAADASTSLSTSFGLLRHEPPSGGKPGLIITAPLL